jgi:hypothetical protein
MEGTRVVHLTVAEMTPEDVRLAVAFAERELQLMQETATPALELLKRVADGDRSMPPWELCRAREMAATLVRVQQQTDRLRTAVRALQPAAAD